MFYVRHGERVHYTSCRLVNDTLALCRAPKLEYGRGSAITSLKYGLRVQDPEYHEMDLLPPRDPHGYTLHPDPVFLDFVTDGHTLTINGRDLDRGFRPQDDLTVRFRGTGNVCDVTSTDRQRIVCVVTTNASVTDLATVIGVIVTIGDTFACVVKRKADSRSRGLGGGPSDSLVAGVKIVCLIAIAIACIAVYRTKARHRVGATARASAASAACNHPTTAVGYRKK